MQWIKTGFNAVSDDVWNTEYNNVCDFGTIAGNVYFDFPHVFCIPLFCRPAACFRNQPLCRHQKTPNGIQKIISKNAEVVGPLNSFDITLLCAILAPKWVTLQLPPGMCKFVTGDSNPNPGLTVSRKFIW